MTDGHHHNGSAPGTPAVGPLAVEAALLLDVVADRLAALKPGEPTAAAGLGRGLVRAGRGLVRSAARGRGVGRFRPGRPTARPGRAVSGVRLGPGGVVHRVSAVPVPGDAPRRTAGDHRQAGGRRAAHRPRAALDDPRGARSRRDTDLRRADRCR